MAMNEIHFESIDSTNTYAKNNSAAFPLEQITCITAEEQTAGRGRYQRSWLSPKGSNIYASFHFRLPISVRHPTTLAQVMTASIATVLETEGLKPTIKWPNDIQLAGKKICGVLGELIFQGAHVIVILGVGLNVNMELTQAARIDQPATSLKIETGKTWDKARLLTKLQQQFADDLNRFKAQGFQPFHPLIERLLVQKGAMQKRVMKVYDGKKEWLGTYDSLNLDGSLNIRLEDQSIHTLYAGEIDTANGTLPNTNR